MILEGEIKDAKMSSFSSDFQTLIKLLLYFLYELLTGLRRLVLTFESADENLWCYHSIEFSYADKSLFIAGVKIAYRVPS